MSEAVSNEVLLEKINNVHSTTVETLTQVKQTNGRVKSLEIKDAVNDERYKLYQKFLYIIIGMIMSIGGWMIKDYFSSQKNLVHIIDERIQANNDKHFDE